MGTISAFFNQGRHLGCFLHTSCAFATDCNFRSITTKQTDIALDPLQCESLIEQASVDNAVSHDFIRRQEPKSSKLGLISVFPYRYCLDAAYAILYGNSNEAVVVCIDDGAHILITLSHPITSTMDPHQYR